MNEKGDLFLTVCLFLYKFQKQIVLCNTGSTLISSELFCFKGLGDQTMCLLGIAGDQNLPLSASFFRSNKLFSSLIDCSIE